MAVTAQKPRSAAMKAKAAGARSKTATSKAAKPRKPAKPKAAALAKKAPSPTGSGLVAKASRAALKTMARRGLRSSLEAVRTAADRSASLAHDALESTVKRRPPIQVSVDVAVPLEFAWDEWMSFSALTEGVHQIEDVERDGDRLFGRTGGRRSSDWTAEIVDEREHQSFAWRSVEGSDCAGLATFHRLSDRLTRIELDLDLLPTHPLDAVALALGNANRHAEADLRRFKAHVEFIDPDVYEDSIPQNGNQPHRQDDG
jgi:uncharacterized membrane protein